ncbi:MAG: phage-associated protein [Fibrobacteres bacterium]|nr:phage-associated protein [Fibrobacterota bacterium]
MTVDAFIPDKSGASKLAVVDSLDLAAYIVAKLGAMSHLKLQKLLYYCEAYHLAFFEKSIIKDEFQAWVHGPVSVKVWVALKDKANVHDFLTVKADQKPALIKKIKDEVSKEQLKLIDDLLSAFGKKTSFELEALTHEEQPWIEARRGTPPNEKSKTLLSKRTMKSFYQRKYFAA